MSELKITNECNMKMMARYEDNHFDLAIVDGTKSTYNLWVDQNERY